MKKVSGFSYSKNMANFEVFHLLISSSINFLFLKSGLLSGGTGTRNWSASLLKIMKYGKNLAKNEEKSCSTCLQPISPRTGCRYQKPAFGYPLCRYPKTSFRVPVLTLMSTYYVEWRLSTNTLRQKYGKASEIKGEVH